MPARYGNAATGIGAAVVVVLILLAVFSLSIVGVGDVGILNTFGVVDPRPRPEGLLIKAPWTQLITLSVRTQQITMSSNAEDSSGTSEQTVRTLTKEGLTVGVDITTLFRLDFARAPEVFRTIGKDYRAVIVLPAIRNAIRDVVAQFTAEALYTTERQGVALGVLEALRRSLAPRGVVVEEVLLRDVSLPEVISQAIEAKLGAEQSIQEKQFRVEEAKREAQRKIEEAEGQKRAQELVNQTLTPAYLQYLYIANLANQKQGNVIYVPTNPQSGLPVILGAGATGVGAPPTTATP
ncbi:MAG: prohibitin family protein [Actinobacteria bacterium]|nr:prohibitin family protein [Actinomycetota bacterium]